MKVRKDDKSPQQGARGKLTKTLKGKEVAKIYSNSNYVYKEKT